MDVAAQSPPSKPSAPRWLVAAPWLFVALWSFGYTPTRVAVEYCEPIFMLAVRYMGVLAILIPAFLVVRPPLPQRGRDWMHLAIVGFLIQGVYFTLTNIAIKLGASAAGLGIVLAMQPILVGLLAPRLAGEQVSRQVWLGLLLGLAGVAIVVLAKSSAGATLAGIVTAFAALVFITAGTLWEKRFGTSHHPIVANLIQCSVALAVALAAAAPLESFAIDWSWPFAWSMLYLVVGNSIIAMTLMLAMIRYGQVTRASSLLFLVPPGSALLAWLILGEPMPALAWLGMVVAGLGVWIVNAKPKIAVTAARQKDSPSP